MIKLLILITFLLSGCMEYTIIDLKLKPYVDEFSQTYGVDVSDISYYSKDLPTKIKPDGSIVQILGQCTKINGKSVMFTIHTDFYNENLDNYYAMHQLIFHELGHCILHREHDYHLNEHGMPKSIMYPQYINLQYYKDNIEYYINSLK